MRASRLYTGPGLHLAFNEEELAYLEKEPRFVAAVIGMRTSSDFERVCDLGEHLLADSQVAFSTAGQNAFRLSGRTARA